MIYSFDNKIYNGANSISYCRPDDRYELIIGDNGKMLLDYGYEPVISLSSQWEPCNDSFVIEVYKLIDSYYDNI